MLPTPLIVGIGVTTGTTTLAVASPWDAIVAIAVPLNTLILFALAYYSKRHGEKIDAVQTTATNAAQASASAATVAADAARITKELGGLLRSDSAVILPVPPQTPTHAPTVLHPDPPPAAAQIVGVLSVSLTFVGYLLVYASVANHGRFVKQPWVGVYTDAYDGDSAPSSDASEPLPSSGPAVVRPRSVPSGRAPGQSRQVAS